MKKTTFCVHIFDISPFVFTQIMSGRACWMHNLILHPTSTHTAYFWWTPLSQKQWIPEKMWWWHHHHVFSGIYCFWGSGVRQKYAVWLLVGCRIKFCIWRALPIEIWVKTQGDMLKSEQKSSFFMIHIPKFILKNCLRGAPILNFKAFWLDNTWWHGICIISGRPILNLNFL